MKYKKITEADLQGIGVIGLPDTPELSCEDMQAKFEQTAREVIIPAHNRLVSALTENGQPVQSRDILQIKKGEDGDLLISSDGKIWLKASPAALEKKADKEEVYTKEETEAAISERVKRIGSADMTKNEYDKDGDGKIDMSNDSEKLGGQPPAYYRKAPVILTAILTATGWAGSGPYTQSVNVSGVMATDNPVADISLSRTTATAQSELENFGYISKIETAAGKITATCFEEKPTVNLTVRLLVVR